MDQGWHVYTNSFTVWDRSVIPLQVLEGLPPRNDPGAPRVHSPFGSTNAQQILRFPILQGYVTLSSSDFTSLASSRFGEVLATTRFWVAPGALPHAGAAGRLALERTGVGDPVPLLADGATSPFGTPVVPGSFGSVRVARYEAEDVRLEVVVPPEGGWLASTERFANGWRAFVDGAEVPVRRVNYAFRGHELPPGRHEVVWTYDTGAWVTLVALGWIAFAGACASAAVLSRRERRAERGRIDSRQVGS
jgi:hypothetical protein